MLVTRNNLMELLGMDEADLANDHILIDFTFLTDKLKEAFNTPKTTQDPDQENVEVWGNRSLFKDVSVITNKVDNWEERVQVLKVSNGLLFRTALSQLSPNGSYNTTISQEFVPGASFKETKGEDGKVNGRPLQ